MAPHLQTLKLIGTGKLQDYVDELRALWLEMMRSDVPALILAISFAVGTLVSMVPIPVVDMLVAGLVMRALHRLPRGPIVAAMAIWNSVIMAPVYATSPRVGGLVLTTAAAHSNRLGPTDALLPRIIVGNVAIAIAMAGFSFLAAAVVFSVLHWQRAQSAAGALDNPSLV